MLVRNKLGIFHLLNFLISVISDLHVPIGIDVLNWYRIKTLSHLECSTIWPHTLSTVFIYFFSPMTLITSSILFVCSDIIIKCVLSVCWMCVWALQWPCGPQDYHRWWAGPASWPRCGRWWWSGPSSQQSFPQMCPEQKQLHISPAVIKKTCWQIFLFLFSIAYWCYLLS